MSLIKRLYQNHSIFSSHNFSQKYAPKIAFIALLKTKAVSQRYSPYLQSLVCNIREQSYVPCLLYGRSQLSLMISTSARYAARKYLSPLRHALAKSCRILVVDLLRPVNTELTNFLARSFLYSCIDCLFHNIHSISAFAVVKFSCLLRKAHHHRR